MRNLKTEHYSAETKGLSLMCFNLTSDVLSSGMLPLIWVMNDKNFDNVLCQMSESQISWHM